MKKTVKISTLILFMLIQTAIMDCFADVKINQLEKVFDEFLIGGDAQILYRADSNPYFGAQIGSTDDTDSSYSELMGKLRLTSKKDIGWSKLEAQFAAAFAKTVGQDFYGAADNTDDVKIDQAWLKFEQISNSPFNLTVGTQDIKIEKQFLVGDGRGQDAAIWLQGINSFPFAVVADGDLGAFKPKLFYAQSEKYTQTWEGKDDVDLLGLNLHYDIKEKMYVYGGFTQKIDNSYDKGFNEQDTTSLYAGFDMAMEEFQIEGEAVVQSGDVKLMTGEEKDRDALAWNMRAKYTAPIAYSPYLRLHYVSYGGDDSNDDDIQEFDPMFGGFADWNYTVIGEIVGESQLPAINRQNYIFEVGCSPTEATLLQAMYIVHRLDEPYAAMGSLNPVELSSRNWADEVDLMFTWPVSDNLMIFLLAGVAMPDEAAEEFYGSDERAAFGQAWFMYKF